MPSKHLTVSAIAGFAVAGAIWSIASALAAAPDVAAAPPKTLARPAPLEDRPLDIDYAVPGVLDYRSWRPAFDHMPKARRHREPPRRYARHIAPTGATATPTQATASLASEDQATG